MWYTGLENSCSVKQRRCLGDQKPDVVSWASLVTQLLSLDAQIKKPDVLTGDLGGQPKGYSTAGCSPGHAPEPPPRRHEGRDAHVEAGGTVGLLQLEPAAAMAVTAELPQV